MKKILIIIFLIISSKLVKSQDDLFSSPLDKLNEPREYIRNAFKSSRVINGHSIEFIGKGVMDFRILHRFGELNTGFKNLYGLDQASMRMGFDFGLSDRVTVGFGRSTTNKEFDGFIKYRPLWQSRGGVYYNSPITLVLVSGITVKSGDQNPNIPNYFSNRVAFYNQVIIGRKFNNSFTLQVSPTMVHINMVPLITDSNSIYSVGIGGRLKLSKRVAFVADYFYSINGLDKTRFKDPLSLGFDIETGGHVFQLHFSNSAGMNEKEFITNTKGDWNKLQVRFGFNLSRVFTISSKK